MGWIANSLVATLVFVAAFTCLDKASTHLRTPMLWSPGAISAVVAMVLSTFIVSTVPACRKEVASLGSTGIVWMTAFSVLLYLGNVLFFSALVEAPNPGLARAILSLEVIGTTLAGVLLSSKGVIGARQVVGMLVVVVGILGVVY